MTELVPGSEQAVKAILGAGRDQVFEATERLDIDVYSCLQMSTMSTKAVSSKQYAGSRSK